MTENAVRNLAEKPTAYAKDTVEKSTVAADEALKVVEQTYTMATKGAADLNLRLIEIARANTIAAFDFAQQLIGVKSPSEFLELSAAHSRKQFEMLTEQFRQLSTLAQKVATDSAQTIQTGATKAFNKVA